MRIPLEIGVVGAVVAQGAPPADAGRAVAQLKSMGLEATAGLASCPQGVSAVDVAAALAKLDNDREYPEEEGESRAHTYHWIANLATLGIACRWQRVVVAKQFVRAVDEVNLHYHPYVPPVLQPRINASSRRDSTMEMPIDPRQPRRLEKNTNIDAVGCKGCTASASSRRRLLAGVDESADGFLDSALEGAAVALVQLAALGFDHRDDGGHDGEDEEIELRLGRHRIDARSQEEFVFAHEREHLRAGDPPAARQIQSFLTHWLTAHILDTDQRYKPFVQQDAA